jgi:hypothetical protein
MGSKGSNTTTTNQNQSQTQSYAPTGAGYITSALDRATSAAAQPFNIPQAPVAGFSGDQQQAFQQFRDAQGMAQPYFNQAAGYYSPQGAQDFLNPYSASVMANLKDVFGQQTSQNTGKLTQAAGGIGADRIAVGQAELAKQQGLVAGQTLSGMYDNAVRQAQSAGQGQMALGQASQNAALSGANALYGAGTQQQQLQQQQLNSPYQQQLAQAAFPYQQAQFLSGITGSLAPSLGGTTSGTSTGTSTKTTPAPSLWSQILGGVTGGVGALGTSGAFGDSGWLTGSGKGSDANSPGWASGQLQNNASSPYYGPGFAEGGNVVPMNEDLVAKALAAIRQATRPQNSAPGEVVRLPSRKAEGGATQSPYELGGIQDDPIDISRQSIVPDVQLAQAQPHIPQLNFSPMPQDSGGGSGSGGKGGGIGDIAKMAMMFINRGGRVNSPYSFADGGGVDDDPGLVERAARALHSGRDLARRKLYNQTRAGLFNSRTAPEHGATYGGLGLDLGTRRRLDMSEAQSIADKVRGYADGGEIDMESPTTFDERFPFRMPSAEAVDDWRANVPDPDKAMALAASEPSAPASLPRAVLTGASAAAAPPLATEDVSRPSRASVEAPERDTSSRFASSPWAALMAAGLGMMAGDSPYAGINIGQGGLQGMKVLEAQRAASQKDTTIAQAARRLAQEAKQHEDPYTRMTAAQKATSEMAARKQALEELKPVQVGQDDYGRPIMAKRNPKTGEYEIIKQTPPTAGERPAVPVAPPVPGAAPGSSVPAAGAPPPTTDEAALPPNAMPTQGILPNGLKGPITPSPTINPVALEGVKPSDAAKVKAIAEGRARFLPLTRNNAYNRYIMDKVHEYDPATDETAFSRRSRTANGFAAGVEGRNVTAMNTFGQHAERLLALSEKLDFGQYPSWNAVRARLSKEGLSEPEIQEVIGSWQVAAKAVGDEGAKVFAGTNSALADREEWGKMFDVNSPKSVTKAKLQEVVKLIEGRLNSLTEQYNNGMRTTHEPKDLIAPKTREIFDAIVAGKEVEKETPKEAGGDPGAAKVGDRKQFRQGWGRWDGKDWVPE